jgi:PTH1 family peptidyl-tRNA hydrolase
MKLVVGLGNPGQKYSRTRHNIGFGVADCFAGREGLAWKDYRDIAVISRNDDFVLVKPVTFMNESGRAVRLFASKNNVAGDDLLVVHDDMDIAFGRVMIKRGGSAGGHNGVKSVVEALGSDDFVRVRVGIGRPPVGTDPVDFVLSGFSGMERVALQGIVDRAAEAVSVFINSGLIKAMNVINRRVEPAGDGNGGIV